MTPIWNSLALGSPFLTYQNAGDYPYKDERLIAQEREAAANAPGMFNSNPQMADAIKGLLTPGLVPDIARQSAEVAAGRGVAGSPAADSTAVRMSEQNWLQRLGLANTLLSGETARTLPYQITPYQSAYLLQHMFPSAYGGRRAGGGGGSPYGGGIGSGLRPPTTAMSPYAGLDFSTGIGTPQVGGMSGGSGLGDAWTLDDTYEWLGFGNFGSQPGDWTNPPETGDEWADMFE